jgi:D-3-phosphoglycerate dehydrogenase / 2-oxoglutarate reductase
MQTIIVTAASLHPDAVALLRDFKLVYADVRADEATLAELCAREQPVAILVRYGRVSEKVIDAAGAGLRVISKHGVGTDNIDKAAAADRGIPVLAALGSNSQAVAEHTIALMLACARRVTWLDSRMRAGHWDKEGYAGLELQGSTLGLIGVGSIGRRVGLVAAALGMQVLVHDPYAKHEDLPQNARQAGVEEVLRNSDIVSLHCPLTADTRALLNRERLGWMQPGAILVNTARAELIDEEALLEALHQNRIFAGIDCFMEEPPRLDEPLLSAPNVVLTPHIGGTTTAAFRAMGVGAAQHILDSLSA